MENIDLEFNQAASNVTNLMALVYTIYWAFETDPYVMYSLCGLDRVPNSQRLSFNWHDPSSTHITKTVTGLRIDTIYKLNVVVTDTKGQSTVYSTATAHTTDVTPPTGVPLSLILGIVLPVGFVLIITMIYLVVRNRKLSKELTFEMHDIPKSALDKAASGPKNYEKLLEDEESQVQSGVTYHPPGSTGSIQSAPPTTTTTTPTIPTDTA